LFIILVSCYIYKCTVKHIIRGHIEDKENTSDLFEFIWNFYYKTRKRWPLNRGDSSIQVTSWPGLIVYGIEWPNMFFYCAKIKCLKRIIQIIYILYLCLKWLIWIDFWCFNVTFNNISAISWRPVLVVEEAGSNRREPPTTGNQLVNFITWGCESSATFL
jgi:hypothetical protein